MERIRHLRPSPLALLAFAISYIAYGLLAFSPFQDPDMPWHLAAGDYMLDHGLPARDPWSFTAGDAPWYNISWAWDIAIALLARWAGPAGLYMLPVLIGALTIALLVECLKRRGQLSDEYILLTAMFAGLCLKLLLTLRPHIISWPLICVFHHLVYRGRYRLLPWLVMLWVNLHGSFFVAFIILGAYMAEAFETGQKEQLRRLMTTTLLCALACLVNPQHVGIVNAVLGTLASSILPYVSEWHPLTFGHQALGFSVFIAMLLLVSNLLDSRIRTADRILAYLWLLAGMISIRNSAVTVLVAAPYFGYRLQETCRHFQKERFRAQGNLLSGRMAQWTVFLSPVACILATAVLLHQHDFSAPSEKDPFHMKDIIALVEEQAPDARFLNDYNLGGNLIYYSDGTFRVFVDGRAGTAYPEALLEDYIDFHRNDTEESRNPILDKYRITGLILQPSSPLEIYYRHHPGWRRIGGNDTAVVLVRNP